MFEHATTAPPRAYEQVFPACPDQVSQARWFLASLLGGHPAASDAITCLSELCTNAISHSRSSNPGGTFTVRLRRSGPAIRIEVTDNGGPWGAPPDDPEHGRGLLIVRAIALRSGITLDGPPECPRERTIWYELRPE